MHTEHPNEPPRVVCAWCDPDENPPEGASHTICPAHLEMLYPAAGGRAVRRLSEESPRAAGHMGVKLRAALDLQTIAGAVEAEQRRRRRARLDLLVDVAAALAFGAMLSYAALRVVMA